MTTSDKQHAPTQDDATSGQTERLETLKDLVRRSAYSVPSDELAARIIGHAFGLPSPARPRRT